MKVLKSIFSPRKLLIWIFIILIAITVPEFTEPAMSQTEAIVNMLCVDKTENNFNVSTTVLTPSQEKTTSYQVYSGSGETLGEAVENISLTIGKEMGFAQCEIMAFGEQICEDGVLSALDYLTRTRKVGRNAILINYTGDGKDFCNAISKISTEKNIKLENIINFDKRYILSRDSNIDSFYEGYFSEISLGIMPQIKLENIEPETAIEVMANASSSAAATKEETKEKKHIVNDGTMSVFKKGKKVLEVEPEMVKRINLFLNISQQGTLKVENVTDDLYSNATVILSLSEKQIKLKPSFKNNVPMYEINISLTILVEEVMEENPNKDFLRRNKEFLTPALIEKLKETTKQEMESVISYCKENEVDLMNVYRQFNRKKYKEFKNYYNNEKENYLNNIQYSINVQVQSAY